MIGIGILFLFTATGCGTLSTQKAKADATKAIVTTNPTVSISPPVILYKEKVNIMISGSGFEPGTKLRLHIPLGNTTSDIRYLVRPQEPVTNKYGAFACVWSVKRVIRKKLLKPTAYTLTVLDMEGNKLATAPMVFCDTKAKK